MCVPAPWPQSGALRSRTGRGGDPPLLPLCCAVLRYCAAMLQPHLPSEVARALAQRRHDQPPLLVHLPASKRGAGKARNAPHW